MSTPVISETLRLAAAASTGAALRKLEEETLQLPVYMGLNNVDALPDWLEGTEKRLKKLYQETASRKLKFDMEAAPVRAILYSELKKVHEGNCEINMATMAKLVGIGRGSVLFSMLIQGVTDGTQIRRLRECNLLREELRAAVNAGHSESEVAKMLRIPEESVRSIAKALGIKTRLNRNNRKARPPSPRVVKRRRTVDRMLREGCSVATISKKIKAGVSTIYKDQRVIEGAVFRLA